MDSSLKSLQQEKVVRRVLLVIGIGLGALVVPELTTAQEPSFELKEGDRVALIGATLIERDRHFGHVEAILRSRYPGKRLEFRNMAWPGDTTTVQLRPLNFGAFEKHVAEQKPTVALICYGSNEAFEGPTGLQQFLEGYNRICDVLEKTATRIAIVSPIRHENLGPPLPDPKSHNSNLKVYVSAVDKLARERNYPFVNLFDGLGQQTDEPLAYPLTENGIHLSNYGYWRAAALLAEKLDGAADEWKVAVDADGRLSAGSGVRVNGLEATLDSIRFMATSSFVPIPIPPDSAAGEQVAQPQQLLKVAGLAAGDYTLKVDGNAIKTASAEEWSRGVSIAGGPDFEQGRALRREVVWKNLLFFHRWRAHNGEYIYGRRASTSDNWRPDKDGGNSGNPAFPQEMAEFDRLIQESDQKANGLAKPKTHSYELVRR